MTRARTPRRLIDRMPVILGGIAAAVLALGVAALATGRDSGSSAAPAPKTAAGGVSPAPGGETAVFDLNGSFALAGHDPKAPCGLQSAFPDVVPGARVVVRSATGTTLGTSLLHSGGPDAAGTGCIFPFTVRSLPKADAYAVGVGERGALSFSYDQMVSQNWVISINLGN